VKSIIASLRSLTLPFGATTGPRIVLNGVLGRIEIYSNAGNLLMTLDDDGLVVYDAEGDVRQNLGVITDFSSIVFKDADGLNSSIITYGPIPGANDFREWDVRSPSTDKASHRLIFLTPRASTVKNPLLQWDTGTLDSSVAQPIADFTGFTGAREAVVAAADYKIASNNGGGNAPTLGASLPRGVLIGGRVRVTANTTFSTETVVGTTSALTLVSGRRYRFAASWRSVIWGTAAAAVLARMRIRNTTAGTVRMEHIREVNGGTARTGGTMEATLDCPGEIGAGSNTFDLTAERISGTGTLVMEAAGTFPVTLTVEDVGATT